MPIVIKDFSWDESESELFITVPLKGVRANKVDILTTETYIKASFPPYIFECFLHREVKDLGGAAQVGNGVILFKLEKLSPCIWNTLQNENRDNKLWQREQRDLAVQQNQERAAQREEMKKEQKRQLEKFGVQQQMNLEDADRSRIEDLKNTERKKAMDELDEWKRHQDSLAQEEKLKAEKAEQEQKEAKQKKKSAKGKAAKIFQEEAGDTPVRENGSIAIKFTPRVFPTPQRESLSHEEEAWLKKQADARRVIETADADLTEEERNPMFLKDKADKFFKAGDLQAAINAYSMAIRLNPQMPSLYSNRAACQLKLNNLFRCAEDCTKAIELLTPPVAQNAASRFKAHVRRGTAYAKLELYVEGLQDYEAALKIDPSNEQVKADADRLRDHIQTSSDYT